MFTGKDCPGPAKTGDDFIKDQQRTNVGTALAESWQECVVRNPDATFALNRLNNDRRDCFIDCCQCASGSLNGKKADGWQKWLERGAIDWITADRN